MPGILNKDDPRSSGSRKTASSFFIGNTRYSNSAAKFWFRLADELATDYPPGTSLELSTPAAGRLTADLLFPELALGRQLERLILADLENERQNTLAELEITGPPPPVHARLFCAQQEIYASNLPLDIIDAEIFDCLVAWQLKWAGIPVPQWNDHTLSGSFKIEDRTSGTTFSFSFLSETQHVSEGLFSRKLTFLMAE